MKKSRIKKLLSLVCASVMIFSLSACALGGAKTSMDNAASAPGSSYYNGSVLDGDLTSGEGYTEIVENNFVSAAENPNSYFSIDANTASYPNLRNLITRGYGSIPKDAVRVEEMLNYFDYDYETPSDGSVLSLTSSVFDTPYNEDTKLLTIGLAAQKVDFSGVKNNLVFLIDVSGSMYSDDKLPLVQQAFMMLAENLNPEDRVSIVTYASGDSVPLSGAYGYEKQKIVAAIEDLTAGGSTAGSKGIKKAYALAEQYFIEGGNNRVILATDGDFNLGTTTTIGLEHLISEKRESGIYLSVFGFGRGNVQSEKMETLALKGNGVYSYIDSVNEAKRALVEGIGGSMVTVAKDVKAGITFNPEYVESYRLVGYENKLLTEEEFNDSNTDAGELGSGHTVTVVYEIVMTDKAVSDGGNIAEVVIKYKPTENVGGDATTEQSLTLAVGADRYHSEMTATDAFVSSVVEFALILRDSSFKADSDLNALITRLSDLDLSGDEFKAEFRDLVIAYREIWETK